MTPPDNFDSPDGRTCSGPAPGIEVTHEPEIPVRLVQLWLCDPCIDGNGEECHTPGCSLWLNRPPDLPLRDSPFVKILPGPCGVCDGSGLLEVPDGDGESASQQTCPDPIHDSDDWFEVGDADAGTSPEPQPAPGHILVMRGTIALRDAEIELLRERLADAEYQRDRWIADAASWERRAAERDRFWNALFYIAHRTPDYVPYAGPECVQVAKDAIDGSEQPPAAPELTTPEKP